MLDRIHDWHDCDDPVLAALNEGVRAFLGPEQQAALQHRGINNLDRDPQNIPELLQFSRLANTVYEEMTHRKHAWSHRPALGRAPLVDAWKRDLQYKLYDLRDQLLRANPALLAHFSLSRQYTHVAGPEDRVPARLQRLEQQLGTVLFTGCCIKSECGVFANQLFRKLRALAIDDALLTLKDDLSRDGALVSPEHVRAIAEFLKTVNRVGLSYAQAHTGICHVKTQIGADDRGMIITLEAHTNRPFTLAPEVCVYRNRDEFAEQPRTASQTRPIPYEMNGMDEIAPMIPVGQCGQRALSNLTNSIRDDLQTPLGVNPWDFAAGTLWRTQLVDSILEGKARQFRALAHPGGRPSRHQ